MDFIEWRPTPDRNVEVLNDTAELYRYFDARRKPLVKSLATAETDVRRAKFLLLPILDWEKRDSDVAENQNGLILTRELPLRPRSFAGEGGAQRRMRAGAR
jgi:hypothetical protein